MLQRTFFEKIDNECANVHVQQKAAPRFELGVKDLQSSALPLGHAANLSGLQVYQIFLQIHHVNLIFISNKAYFSQ